MIGGTDGPSSTFADNFNGTASYTDNNGTAAFTGGWTETGDVTTGNIVTGGQIRIQGGGLVFGDNDNDPGNGGAQIQRSLNLSGVSAAILSYSYDENSFDAGETVQVQFSADGTTFTTIQTIDGNSGEDTFSVRLVGPFTATAAIRFVVSGTNNNSGSDTVVIDNLVITAQRGDLLNGGLGNDTYGFGLADGNDVITDAGGTDRVTIAQGTPANPLDRTLGPAPGERGPDSRLQRADGHRDRRVRQCGRRGRVRQLQQQRLRRARAGRRLRGQLRHR